jgi:hypothetical protein
MSRSLCRASVRLADQVLINAPKETQMKQSVQFHGGIRGAEVPKRSRLFDGRFGRMFRNLPAAQFDDADLVKLADTDAMLSAPEVDSAGCPVATPETDNPPDGEENLAIPAGYTYLGQFVDHDISFDPASSLDRLNDPEALTDFRTPRLDLDCLYGRGPDDQPYLYDPADMRKFFLGDPMTFNTKPSSTRDLPRFNKRALIGDKRNDENVIVSQLQGAFLQFHNKMVDKRDQQGKRAQFADIQQEVRWHYQYLVLHDFLPRICGAAIINQILPHLQSRQSIFDAPPRLNFYHWKNDAFIPIEFSAAAYSFGHSMVRPIYRLNTELDIGGSPVGEDNSLAGRHLSFAGVSKRALNGFGTFPLQWAIDWRLFFGEISTTRFDMYRVQPSYKIDSSLVNPLGFLPEFSLPDTVPPTDRLTAQNFQAPQKPPLHVPPGANTNNLALRNLRRGAMMGLPSGQDVARAMGLTPLPAERILIGKAVHENGSIDAKPITQFADALGESTPLWAYILAEATAQWHDEVTRRDLTGAAANFVGTHLGPVGGRIVAETLIGLLLADGHSYLSQDPNWLPSATRDGACKGDYTMVDFLQFAGLHP